MDLDVCGSMFSPPGYSSFVRVIVGLFVHCLVFYDFVVLEGYLLRCSTPSISSKFLSKKKKQEKVNIQG